jgi:hypothetical protein
MNLKDTFFESPKKTDNNRPFTKVKTLGIGSSGQAILIKYKDTNEYAVVKTIDMFTKHTDERRQIFKEAELL